MPPIESVEFDELKISISEIERNGWTPRTTMGSVSHMLSVDDGFASGNFNLADILFFLATIVFFIAFVLEVLKKESPRPVYPILIAAGLTCVSLAWFVL